MADNLTTTYHGLPSDRAGNYHSDYPLQNNMAAGFTETVEGNGREMVNEAFGGGAVNEKSVFQGIIRTLSPGGYQTDKATMDPFAAAEVDPFLWNLTSVDFQWSNLSADNLSSSNNGTGDIDSVFLPGAILSGIFLALVVVMTIIGNILVLVAVAVNPHLRGTTHYFIANLAVADLLLGTTVLPFSASLEIVNYWAFGQHFCNIWAAMDVLCCTASIMNLCVISIDRYIGVTRPLQHSRIMSEKRAFYIIILVWILSLCISVAPYFGWKEPPPADPTVCEITKQLGYVLFSVSGSFYIPLIIILIVYFRVYREALSQSRFLSTGVKRSKSGDAQSTVTLRIHTGGGSSGHSPSSGHKHNVFRSSTSSDHSVADSEHCRRAQGYPKLTMAGKIAKFKREKKAAKTLGIVVGVFILCWFPFFFCLPLEALCLTCNVPGWLFKIIFWLGYCNSMMNPIIYACSSREFKRAFIRILRCQFRRNSRPHMSGGGMLSSQRSPDITRLAKINHTLRFLTRRRAKRKASNNKRLRGRKEASSHHQQQQDGSHQGLLWSASSGGVGCGGGRDNQDRLGNESPIPSLRHLHDKQRLGTGESIVISDDESAIHELSDEEEVHHSPAHQLPLPCHECQSRSGIIPPVIQINSPAHVEKETAFQMKKNDNKISHSFNSIERRKLSLPVSFDDTMCSSSQPNVEERPQINAQCNGVKTCNGKQTHRAKNIESVKWKRYKEYSRSDSETGGMVLQLPGDTDNKPVESDRLIYEVVDERIMWL